MTLSVSGTNGITLDGQFNSASSMGFKNRIINGAMGIWQRGTSFTNPQAGGAFYTADRWGCNRANDSLGATVSRSTSAPSGFQYSLCLQRTAGNANTDGVFMFNSNETVNTLDLAGQSATLSFWVKTGANYSGGALTVTANWGTGTDQRAYAYTGLTSFISTTQSITSTWTRYSFTGTVGASATEVGFYVYWTPTGTAGADDAIYITGVQLEKGSTATSFDYRPYGTELALCQRYYSVGSINNGGGATFKYGTTGATLMFNSAHTFPVEMRDSPTIALGTPTYSNCSSISVTFDGTYSNEGFSTRVTVTTSGIYRALTATWQAAAEL